MKNLTEKNKAFFKHYHNSVSGKKKNRELISSFIEDEKLIGHILFFESMFPEYEVVIDELLAAGDRIFVRSHLKGVHTGEAEGIPATQKTVETPFALGYTIRDDKIVDFWAIANEMELFEQLGLSRDQVMVGSQ